MITYAILGPAWRLRFRSLGFGVCGAMGFIGLNRKPKPKPRTHTSRTPDPPHFPECSVPSPHNCPVRAPSKIGSTLMLLDPRSEIPNLRPQSPNPRHKAQDPLRGLRVRRSPCSLTLHSFCISRSRHTNPYTNPTSDNFKALIPRPPNYPLIHPTIKGRKGSIKGRLGGSWCSISSTATRSSQAAAGPLLHRGPKLSGAKRTWGVQVQLLRFVSGFFCFMKLVSLGSGA